MGFFDEIGSFGVGVLVLLFVGISLTFFVALTDEDSNTDRKNISAMIDSIIIILEEE